MLPRERVLKTLRFERVDRPPCDLMEGVVWPELREYFHGRRGLTDKFEIQDHLRTDFRWIGMESSAPPGYSRKAVGAFSNKVATGPLAGAETLEQIRAYPFWDPDWWQPADYAAFHRRWPDHARVFNPGWRPLFWTACEAFGMEDALTKLALQPELFEAFLSGQQEFFLAILSRGLAAAEGHCDLCLLGDDFAGQKSMLISPAMWRRHIKPLLAEQVRLVHRHGMMALFHSCGAVRPVLDDLIEIGVNALLVFQTSATGMEARSIAAKFGGRLAFYGGIDVQGLLSFGSESEVRAEVRANIEAFAECGGYVVANSHHGVSTIQGGNLEAMFEEARRSDVGVERS